MNYKDLKVGDKISFCLIDQDRDGVRSKYKIEDEVVSKFPLTLKRWGSEDVKREFERGYLFDLEIIKNN